MARWVPVLGKNDVAKVPRQTVYRMNDFIAARHGQFSAGAEIILHIDGDQDILIGDFDYVIHVYPRVARGAGPHPP